MPEDWATSVKTGTTDAEGRPFGVCSPDSNSPTSNPQEPVHSRTAKGRAAHRVGSRRYVN